VSNYPSIDFLYPLRISTRGKTYVTDLEAGKILRRKLWTDPFYTITGEHNLSASDLSTLENFYRETAEGMVNSFTLTDPLSRAWLDVYVGTGDGTTTVFNLPMKNSTSYTVYKAGVTQTGGGTHYTFGSGTGTDGRDKITFVTAPTGGDRISLDATGNRAWFVIFGSDDLEWSRSQYDRDTVRVTFIEVRD
jgi:hypothetical protein